MPEPPALRRETSPPVLIKQDDAVVQNVTIDPGYGIGPTGSFLDTIAARDREIVELKATIESLQAKLGETERQLAGIGSQPKPQIGPVHDVADLPSLDQLKPHPTIE